jgi:nucleotide-binding universal stress UspA family protein
MKAILAKIDGSANDTAVLESAYLVARRFGGHLACLYVRPDPVQAIMDAAGGMGFAIGVVPITPQVREDLIEAEKAQAANARRTFDAFCRERGVPVTELPSPSGAVSASWREEVGDPVDATATIGRFHDMVVLARARDNGDLYIDDIGAILLACGRPLLLATSPPPKEIGSTIAIAWKDAAEAARAVTAAMPLLLQAGRILVLSADETDRGATDLLRSGELLANPLRRHGLSVHVRVVSSAKRSPSQAIIDAAVDDAADLLVMGAYGHSRARELVFGGVTRHVLEQARLPVLMSH